MHFRPPLSSQNYLTKETDVLHESFLETVLRDPEGKARITLTFVGAATGMGLLRRVSVGTLFVSMSSFIPSANTLIQIAIDTYYHDISALNTQPSRSRSEP